MFVFDVCFFSLSGFLGRARLRLQADELFGHFVVGPLREDPGDGQARLVHVDVPHQRVRGVQADLVGELVELKYSDADDAVLAGEAVILQRDVELVRFGTVFTTQNTEDTNTSFSTSTNINVEFHSICNTNIYHNQINTTQQLQSFGFISHLLIFKHIRLYLGALSVARYLCVITASFVSLIPPQ